MDASCIFLWSPDRGARTVAEVGNADGFEVTLLAWDAPRGILWAAGEFGLGRGRAEAVYRVAIDENGALDAGKTAGLRGTP